MQLYKISPPYQVFDLILLGCSWPKWLHLQYVRL